MKANRGMDEAMQSSRDIYKDVRSQTEQVLKVLEQPVKDLDLSDARMVTYQGKMYLSTLSHLRLVCSNDGKTFYEPDDLPTQIFGQGPLETYGI